MRRYVALLAAFVLLGTSLAAIWGAWRNRSRAEGGMLELTERELYLPPLIGDSTALALDLRWETAARSSAAGDPPAGLTAPKLEELGFDCQLPVTDPHAREHYRAMGARPVFVVLEMADQPPQRRDGPGKARSRLVAIDAGTDPVQLRQRYPDPTRQAIARGLARLFLETENLKDRTPLPQPRLTGQIVELLPRTLFVPRPYSGLLQKLRHAPDDDDRQEGRPPRFTATVCWGADYEPWVSSVRLLP